MFWKQPGSGHANTGPCWHRGLRDAPASSQAGQLAVTPGRVSSLGRAIFTLLAEKLFSEALEEEPWLLVHLKMFNAENVSRN